ncbi:MAG: M23 family metallopeptidase [Anaerolineales bacterium]|nr:M23 family metallopeptidase [Anaerolineales bacterium]
MVEQTEKENQAAPDVSQGQPGKKNLLQRLISGSSEAENNSSGVVGFLARYHRHLIFLLLIVAGIWIARIGFQPETTETVEAEQEPVQESMQNTLPATSTLAETGDLGIEDLPAYPTEEASGGSIIRLANLHTIFPTRERMEIIKYIVQAGDSLYGIAEKFGLRPHTILWGNFEALEGNVHGLQVGQELNILPVDGVLHDWAEGETLTGVADNYGVEVQDIIDWPGNSLDPAINPDDPQIAEGVALVIPGGKGEVVDMTGGQISRSNPAVASILGPGACPTVYDGPVGTGTFIYPTVEHYLSGYDYDPVLHPAVDFAGSEGNAIYASDTGVIVYAGWNNWGYGNVIVIDHGNGWQTLYAHMAYIPSSVYCGMGVYQGAVIGPLGNTGNSSGAHLHFEMRNESYGKVNPWNFLP